MKRWLQALLMTLAGFLFVSFVLAALLGRLLEGVDVTQLPLVFWVLCGPLIGLMSGHGLIFYILGMVAVIPGLAGVAVLQGGARYVAAAFSIVAWCVIGWLMY